MAINLAKITSDLGHTDPQIQSFALISVTRLAPNLIDDPPNVRGLYSRLEELIRSPNPDVVFLARKASNHLRAQFRQMLGEDEAPRPVSEIDPASLDRGGLIAALKRDDLPETLISSLVIRLVDKGDADVLPELARFLRHGNDRVRSNALEVFVKWGDSRHAELVKPLAGDSSNRVRGTALLALDRFDVDVAESLGAMLRMPQISMRETAVWVLSQIDRGFACGMLIRSLEDPYDGIRLRAVRSLAKFPTRESVRALKAAMNDIDINICEAAHESLRALQVLIQGRVEAQRAKAQPEAQAQAQPQAEAAASPRAEAAPAQAQTPAEATPSPTPPAASGAAVGEAGEGPVLRELGTVIYQLCRLNAVTHEQLDSTFYEILRYQDFLRAYMIKKQKQERDGAGGEGAGDAIRQLRGRIEKAFLELGRIARNLIGEGLLKVPADKRAEVDGVLAKLAR